MTGTTSLPNQSILGGCADKTECKIKFLWGDLWGLFNGSVWDSCTINQLKQLVKFFTGGIWGKHKINRSLQRPVKNSNTTTLTEPIVRSGLFYLIVQKERETNKESCLYFSFPLSAISPSRVAESILRIWYYFVKATKPILCRMHGLISLPCNVVTEVNFNVIHRVYILTSFAQFSGQSSYQLDLRNERAFVILILICVLNLCAVAKWNCCMCAFWLPVWFPFS